MHIRHLSVTLAVAVLLSVPGCSNDDSQEKIALLNEEVASLNEQLDSLDAELADANAALETTEDAATEAADEAEDVQQELRDEIARIKREAATESAKTYRTIEDMESGLELACSNMESDLPDSVMAAFSVWLGARFGDVPDDVVITVPDAAGSDGQWVFHARFDQMIEPGLFLARPNDSFEVLFAGMAPSAAGLRSVMQSQFPDEDLSVGGCIDVSPFVE